MEYTTYEEITPDGDHDSLHDHWIMNKELYGPGDYERLQEEQRVKELVE